MRLFALLVLALAVAPSAVRGAAAAQPVAAGGPSRAPTMIEVSIEELIERTRERGKRLTLIDVRSAQEFAASHVPGAINIPLDQIAARAAELPAEGDVVFYCQSGVRSRLAIEVLRSLGIERPLFHFGGGLNAWQAAGQPTDSNPE